MGVGGPEDRVGYRVEEVGVRAKISGLDGAGPRRVKCLLVPEAVLWAAQGAS